MDSTELYRQLLGVVTPWTVQRVEMDVHGLSVDVYLTHSSGTQFICPKCGRSCSVYDHLAERRWRHLDSCHFRTVLHAQPPRIECPDDGVRQVELPWSEAGSRFTRMFESLAIDVLLATDVKNAAAILNITWNEAWHIMERAVVRGRRAKDHRPPVLMGVDEKAYAKRHKYVTLVYDLQTATVEYVNPGRDFASLGAYFKAFSQQQLAGIQGIAMDMCQAYINACNHFVPQADQKMVFDRFHIMRHMLEAVDAVRKRENRDLQQQGDTRLAKASTYGFTAERTSLRSPWTDSSNSRTRTSERQGPGPSRRACATYGATPPGLGPRSSGRGGTSGLPTASCPR